ncbi:hypothetical protein VTK26DRAFT_3882 [Humicola hyalothermophila]
MAAPLLPLPLLLLLPPAAAAPLLLPGFRCAAPFFHGQKKRCSRTGSRWSIGAGTSTAPVSGSTSRGLNIQRPSRRRQVWHEALLGTGALFSSGLVRDCQPRRARARAGRLIGGCGCGCGWAGEVVVVVVVVVVVGVVVDEDCGGGGSVKKLGGR